MECPAPYRFARTSTVLLLVLLSALATNALAQVATSFERGWQSGRPTTVIGVYTAVYADDFANRQATRIDMVRDEQTGEMFRLHFEHDAPTNIPTGSRVQIAGRTYGSGTYGVELFVAGCCESTASTVSTSRALTTSSVTTQSTSDQRTLVIMANFADATLTCSADEVNNTMFADPNGLSVNGLYRDNSRGQISFSGSVVGPYTLDYSSTTCDPGTWSSAARATATAAGVDVASYARFVYVLPMTSCSAAGMGSVGGSPTHAWIYSCGTKGVYAHEIGHNLGMDHAGITLDGSYNELGDGSDPMAMSGSGLPGLNAPHRHQLGWVSPQVIAQSGTYQVAPVAPDPSTVTVPQVYTIAKPDTGEFYYISTRFAQGYDNRLQPYYLNGLSIHRYSGQVRPAAGDVTKTNLLAELTDGQSFTDSVNGITITQVSHDSTRVTARVELTATCTTSAPSITLTPQAQSGSAGSSASYVVSITNGDTPACPASVFSFSAAVPSGWTGTLSTPNLTLSPGATGQANLTVHSAAGAPPGTYVSTFNAAKGSSTAAEVSAAAAYTVQAATDTTSPTAPTGLAASVNQKTKQIQLSWTAATDNVGVAGYRVSRDGVLVGTTKMTTWTDAASTAGATYKYAVVAYDAAGNVSASSSLATVTAPGGTSGGGGGRKK